MFNYDFYQYDRDDRISLNAKILAGALLYKITTHMHCSIEDVLTGLGPEKSRNDGRFNSPQQRTTYCSNNILVCISELLFHMWRDVLKNMRLNAPASVINSFAQQERVLTIMQVNEIDNLVYIDADEVRADYGARMGGTMVVYPDRKYELYTDFANRMRAEFKKGIMYPSARHSQDICVALFEDETSRIARDFFQNIRITIGLIREEQNINLPITRINVFRHKICPTLGYYRFNDQDLLEELKERNAINPLDIPQAGIVDFVRRRYDNYPNDAVIPIRL